MHYMIENYLQKAWTDHIANITIQDVKQAIAEVRGMDDEHGAFWVGVCNPDSNVLECHKDLMVIAIFAREPDIEINAQIKDWGQMEKLYELFLNQDFETVKTIIENNK